MAGSSRKTLVSEFECDQALMDMAGRYGYSGHTYGYVLSNREGQVVFSCDYTMDPDAADRPEQTRAYREMRRSEKRKVPKIGKTALRDELMILPGAAMSPADVITALEKLIKHIKEDGMYVGKYEGHYILEKLEGETKFVTETGTPVF